MPLHRKPPQGLTQHCGGNILHGYGSFAGEVTFIHGSQAWAALDYGNAVRVRWGCAKCVRFCGAWIDRWISLTFFRGGRILMSIEEADCHTRQRSGGKE